MANKEYHEAIVDQFVADGYARLGFRVAVRKALGEAAEFVGDELRITPDAWREEDTANGRQFTCVEVIYSHGGQPMVDRYAMLWHALDFYDETIALHLLLACGRYRSAIDLCAAYYDLLLRRAGHAQTRSSSSYLKR
jgi:hypothetical protein